MRRLRMLVGVVDPAIEDRVGTARESAVAVDADRHPSYGPNGGVADTFENAKATFRRTWDAYGGYLKARVADLRVQTKSFTNGWLAAGTDDASANCVARSLRRTRPSVWHALARCARFWMVTASERHKEPAVEINRCVGFRTRAHKNPLDHPRRDPPTAILPSA